MHPIYIHYQLQCNPSDITTSLQRKQQQIAKLKQRTSLLSDLQALDEQPRVSLTSEEAEDFSEPQPMLPLWRRVDRKFWWNESLLRPFIDAGVGVLTFWAYRKSILTDMVGIVTLLRAPDYAGLLSDRLVSYSCISLYSYRANV